MIWYFTIFFLLIITSFAKNHQRQKISPLIILITGLFLCSGYMTGSDWRGYESYYYNFDNYRFTEPFFIYLNKIFNPIIGDFFIFLISLKLIAFYVLVKFFRGHTENSILSIFLYIPWFGLYLFIDNPFRFMLGLIPLILSYQYMIQRNLFKFSILIIIGSLFHFSIIFFLPFYFFKKSNLSNSWLVILYIIWTFGVTAGNLSIFLELLFKIFPTLNNEYGGYIFLIDTLNEELYTPKVIIQFIVLLVLLFNRHYLESLPNGKLYFLHTLIYLFVSKFAVYLGVGIRLSHFFSFAFIVTLSRLIYLNWKYRKVFAFSFISYTMMYAYLKIDNHYVYIPYTNFFVEKIKQKNYSFQQRDNFNFQDYYNRKGKSYESK